MELKLLLMIKERLLQSLMKNNISEIIKDIFSYNEFVNNMEVKYGHLDTWLDMEILNALALDEWEMSGKPIMWEGWRKYQFKAEKLVIDFFLLIDNK
ncbi:hypothetical protein GFL08_06710 [Glaesserella parasuis]|nr:hypothetical protein [Glaesserella parasuis]